MHNAGSNDHNHPLLSRALTFLALGLLYFGLLQHLYATSEQEQHARLRFQLSTLGLSLEDSVDKRLYLLTELDSYVQNQPDLNQHQFEQVTQEIFNRQPGIRSLQLARDSAISHISPLAGHQSDLGFPLIEKDQKERVILQRHAELSGPQDQLHGGKTLTIKKPIFTQSESDQSEQYWGLAVIRLDWQEVLNESDLPSVQAEYAIALRQTDPQGGWQNAFYGDNQLFFSSSSEQVEVQLPGATWQIAIRSKLSSPHHFRLLAYGCGLLLLLFTIYALLRLSHSHYQLGPGALALLFIVLAGLVTGFEYFDRRSQQQITLSQDLGEQNRRLRTRLQDHLHYLQNLASQTSQHPLTATEFQLRSARRIELHPEIKQIFWLDSERRIRQLEPMSPEAALQGKKLRSLEAQKAALTAQSHHRPTFTHPFEVSEAQFVFDLWLPIYRGDQFIGLIGARFDSQTLLEQTTPSDLRRHYRLRLRNRGGQQYASLFNDERPLGSLHMSSNLLPPGRGVTLELTRYQPPWSQLSLLMLVLLLTMGMLTVLNLRQLLLRHKRLASRHQLQQKHLFQLEREHELLQTTLESIGEGVITTDADGLVHRINPTAAKLCQCSQSGAAGQTLFSVLRLQDSSYASPLRERLKKALDLAIEEHSSQTLTGTLVDKNTEIHSVRCTIAPIIKNRTQFLGNVIILHDLSSMQAMARRLDYRDPTEQHAPLNCDEFELCCKEALVHARETGYHHLLLYIDLSLEKGTETPELLQNLEMPLFRLLKQQVRVQDPLAQLGANRYAVLLRYCTMEQGQQLADKIIRAIDDPGIFWPGPSEKPTISLNIGLTYINDRCEDYSALSTQADLSCYIAKSLGPNHCYQSPVDTEANEPEPRTEGSDQPPPAEGGQRS